MKAFDARRIKQAEAAQLIILHSLFSLRESKEIVFQGGTAIRWFYGGLRFSEDLDFVTSLARDQVVSLIQSSAGQMRRQLVGNFGSGELSCKEKKSHGSSCKTLIDFSPAAVRGKTSVKIEFERLVPGMRPDFDRVIMQSSAAVSSFLREDNLKTPGSPVIVNVETPGEILSDKLRALMERPYTRGRDFFDIWFVTGTLRAVIDAHGLKRKLEMYEVPFSISTPPTFYAKLDTLSHKDREKLLKEISADLERFLSAESLGAFQEKGFHDLLEAVQDAFTQVIQANVIEFAKYPSRKLE